VNNMVWMIWLIRLKASSCWEQQVYYLSQIVKLLFCKNNNDEVNEKCTLLCRNVTICAHTHEV